MTDEPRRTKDRSPNFPYIPLQAAIARSEEFYSKEKRGAAPFSVAASHWRLSPSSSSALQTVAALKSYGLMSDESSGGTRRVRLTDLALRIILDDRLDSKERSTYMRQAALSPAVAAEVYAKWPDGLPSEANLRHFLVLDRGFNDATAHKAVKIILENERLTDSISSINHDRESLPAADISEREIAPVSTPSPTSISPRLVAQTPSIPTGATEVVRVSGTDATIAINFGGADDYEIFDFIEKYGAFRKSLIRKV